MENLISEENGNEEKVPSAGAEVETPATMEPVNGEVSAPQGEPQKPAAEYEFPDELLSATELLRVSWQSLQPRLWKFFYLALLSVLIVGGTVVLCAAPAVLLRGGLGLIVAVPLLLFVVAYLSLLLNAASIGIVQDKELKVREALRGARGKVRPLFRAALASLALFCTVFLPVVLGGVLYALVTAVFSSSGNSDSSILDILNWLLGISVFVWMLALIPFILLLSVWQQFLSFDVVLAGRPVMDSAARAWAMLKGRKKALLWRALVFLFPYFIMLAVLDGPAQESSLVALVEQVAIFLFSFWILMYFYALYRNLEVMRAGEATEGDSRTMRRAVRWGSLIAVLFIFFLLASAYFPSQKLWQELSTPPHLSSPQDYPDAHDLSAPRSGGSGWVLPSA